MTIFFDQPDKPAQTLEDETFRQMRLLYPQASILNWKKKSFQNTRSFLARYKPSLIISNQYIPRYISVPNLIVSSSLPKRHLPWFLRENVSVLSHSPQKTTHKNHLLPPLIQKSIGRTNTSNCFVSIGPFHASSHHHLVLDAYAMLPKRTRSHFSLHFCGAKASQEDIDRLKLHGYGLSIHFVHDPIQTQALLPHAKIVFRMGDSTQKNLPIDQTILEHQHTAIHLKNTPRTYLYSSKYRVETPDPVHVKTLVQEAIRSNSKDLDSPFDAQSVHSKYTFLVHSLQTK